MWKKAVILILAGVLTNGLFAQPDTSVVKRHTRQYTLTDGYSEISPVVMDTLLSGFQHYRATEESTSFYSELGNYGLPVYEMDFFRRSTDPDEFIYRHYKPYMHHRNNKVFIDTQVPFTELVFTFGGARTEAEQTLSVRHSQNISRYFNAGLDLDVINSLGQYSYQATDDRSFTLHSSYLGKKYNMFAAWTINNFKGGENGGMDDLSQLGTAATRDLPVNLGGLNNAESAFRYRELLLVQKYTLGGGEKEATDSIGLEEAGATLKGTFSHVLSWENGRKFYSDDNPDGGFYDTTYITGPYNNVSTYDSLYSRTLRNTLSFDFTAGGKKGFSLDVGAGILNELNLYSQIRPTHDTLLFADTLKWTHSSNAITGRVANRIGEKFRWNASGRLYFTGYKAGDIIADGYIGKVFGSGKWASELYGEGYFRNQEPSFWIQSYGSNHFEWSNDFSRELRIKAGGGLKIPGVNTDISLDYMLLTNYIYFNTEALPAQFDEVMSVLALRVNKKFKFWKFRFDNEILIQKSSHTDILDLPLLCARSSFYFSHLFKFRATGGELDLRLGAEGRYNTAYYAPAYMPSTGFYYNQREEEQGNYPYIDVFLNLKLKRTRFFLSFIHINHGMEGFGNDYMYVPGYLMPGRVFSYGIAWTFYN